MRAYVNKISDLNLIWILKKLTVLPQHKETFLSAADSFALGSKSLNITIDVKELVFTDFELA